MSLPTHPVSRAMKIVLNDANVGLRFYSRNEAGRYYQVALSHEQFADLVANLAAAHAGTGPREFFLGMTEADFATHRIAAVPCPC